jgi:hypothetical protein
MSRRVHVIQPENSDSSEYRTDGASSMCSCVYHAADIILEADRADRCMSIPPSSRISSYSVLCDMNYHEEAIWLLATLGVIIEPFLLSRQIKIVRLYEIHPSSSLLGVQWSDVSEITSEGLSAHDRIEIGLTLRSKNTPERFFPLEVVLDTLCHELAHLWSSDHELLHLGYWWYIRQEVENDLGGKLRIERGQESDHSIEKFRWMAWEVDEVFTAESKAECELRTPSETAIEAARLWESWYWNFPQVREYANLPRETGTEDSVERGRDTVVNSDRNPANEPVLWSDQSPCNISGLSKLELLPEIEILPPIEL